MNTSTEA
jgi:hypothetical protein